MLENIFKNLMPQYRDSDCVVTELGGMTNKNYLVTVSDEQYVLRIPGAKTQNMINREYEAKNSLKMSQAGFNVETCIFDQKSGLKITRFLKNSLSLDHKNIKSQAILQNLATRLLELHQSQIKLGNQFDVFQEYTKYLGLLRNKQSFYGYNTYISDILAFLDTAHTRLNQTGRNKVACHNDLVPENLLLQNDKLYFIDWEYSGMNDPVFDIAAFFLESRIHENEQNLFLQTYYADKEDLTAIKRDILLYQFTQDVLWFVWTLVKAEENEHFGDYGEQRISRAHNIMLDLKKSYG
ncbi:choline kinase [Neisseria wadsworthii 9715]|uniref:Choline kinase n=1 Tax=Neisseria wadsworthii 9715 TaxID=1030841 RepID=G4CNM8_9NEIS|nr:choline kinase [Neisseria wadsworthii 9715]